MVIRCFVAFLALMALNGASAAEISRLKIPDFSHLQAKAVESVDVTVGPFMLWLATKLAPERDEDGTEVKQVLQGIEAVYIRSYQFDRDDAYSMDDVERVREQLRVEQWKPLVEIRNKDAEKVDVFMAIQNDTPVGFAIVASDRREFTIVNIVGTIDPKHIGKLQASWGLPGSSRMAAADD